MQKKKSVYLPHERAGYEPAPHYLVSKSPRGVNTKLPSTVEDDIAANNIACMEFDYTEQPYYDSEEDT